MKRVALFPATNLAILLVLPGAARLLGLDRHLAGGALISLALSKVAGKAAEAWLVRARCY